MKGADVANQLKELIPKYTDEFSDISSVTVLTSSSGTATCVIPSQHQLTTGDFVTVRGVVLPTAITSITRVNKIVSVVTTTDHQLIDPSKFSIPKGKLLTVTLTGVTPIDYNGTFKLLTVTDRNNFTFQIATTPATPATVPGTLLEDDFDGYNGYKQVTVTSPTVFTYTVPTSIASPAQGTIEVSASTRIGWGATSLRVEAFFNQDEDRVLQNWLFVVLGPKSVFKDGTTTTDVTSLTNSNERFFYETQDEFSLFVFIPAKDEIIGGDASDLARELEFPILKSIANFETPSVLCEGVSQPIVYAGNETDEYNVDFYTHRYDFLAKGYVQDGDVVEDNPGVLFKEVDALVSNVEDMTYKVLLSK